MFVVNTKREVTFHHKVVQEKGEPVEFSVTFKFAASEDVDYVKLREKASDKTPLVVEDENGKINKTDMGTYNAFLYTLRTGLQACEGIVDGNGDPVSIKNDKGVVDEDIQIAVFEAVKAETELFNKVTVAYIGDKEKNG